jgi:enterochelin esterase family protein
MLHRAYRPLGFVFLLPLVSLLAAPACVTSEPNPRTTGTAGAGGSPPITGAAGSSGAAGNGGVAGSGGGEAGVGGPAGAGAVAGTNGGAGSGAAGVTGGAGAAAGAGVAGGGAAGSDGGVASDGGGTEAGPEGGGAVDPGREGNGRFMIDRPAVPPEAANLMAGVTAGMMRMFSVTSTIYPNTTRTVQVWTPAGHDATKPTAFMVFHDGGAYVSNFKIPIIFANLIAAKKIPPMIGIFVPPSGARSVEYDTVSDKYARFITTEVLPKVEQMYSIKLTTDPEASGVGGHSSGGICAFSMAWFQPERYRRVLSNSGSFTKLQDLGGDMYDGLVRNTMPRKPIRTAMTVGTMDLGGTRWYMASEMMGKALLESMYDVRYLVINGGTHDQSSPMPTTPELLVWLWRGYPITGPTR